MFMVLLTIILGTWEGVFFVTLISSILSQFSQPSAMKLFKVHVPGEQLQMGMAMFQTLMAIFMIIGPLMGTFVYQRFGIYIAIGVMGVAFLLSAGALTFLPPDRRDAKDKREADFWGELADGFRYVWSSEVLTLLGGAFIVCGFAVGVIQPLGVFIVIERLGLPKENLQWLMMVNGVAMLMGGGLVMGISKKVAPQKLLAIGLLFSAISVAGMGISTSLAITFSLQFLSGLFFPFIHTGITTLILQATREEFVGRVNGVLNPMFMGAMVITMSLAGWLKIQFSLVAMYELAGALFFGGMLLMVPLFKPDCFSEKRPESCRCISESDLKYVDYYVSENFAIFIPSVGFCEYAIMPQHTHPAYSFILFFQITVPNHRNSIVGISSCPGRKLVIHGIFIILLRCLG